MQHRARNNSHFFCYLICSWYLFFIFSLLSMYSIVLSQKNKNKKENPISFSPLFLYSSFMIFVRLSYIFLTTSRSSIILLLKQKGTQEYHHEHTMENTANQCAVQAQKQSINQRRYRRFYSSDVSEIQTINIFSINIL